MDRNTWTANTDIIIFVEPSKKTLTWIPRDVYIKDMDNRINAAYRLGRDELLFKSLKSINYDVSYNLCIQPDAIEDIFNQIETVTVPVEYDRKFKYPLHRHQPIEKGHKIVEFNSPFEDLSGDRIHEWIGARYAVDKKSSYSSDLDRILRQQILVRVILKSKKENIKSFKIANMRGLNDEILEVLKTIDTTWKLTRIRNLEDAYINKKSVFIIK
jgi:anionic cell wall polymer biosynthesis LytR-Cps2A-Psr (LCP) family protein